MKWFFWTQIQRSLKGLRLIEEKEIVHRTRPNGMAGREVAKNAKEIKSAKSRDVL